MLVASSGISDYSGEPDSATTVRTLSPRRLPGSYQRTPAGNRTTARGRYPGSRVVACVFLPKAAASVDESRPLTGYSCGGSRGVTPRSNSNPFREPCACADNTESFKGGTGNDHRSYRAGGQRLPQEQDIPHPGACTLGD